jgi:hypothetical protein
MIVLSEWTQENSGEKRLYSISYAAYLALASTTIKTSTWAASAGTVSGSAHASGVAQILLDVSALARGVTVELVNTLELNNGEVIVRAIHVLVE